MIRITDQHRDAIRRLLEPGETLVAVTGVTRGSDLGSVGGQANATAFDVAEYLHENDIVAVGVPGHAFAAGWVAVTDRRVAFIVHKGFGLKPKPKAMPYSIPIERITLRWRDETAGRQDTRLYHFHLDVGDQGGLHVVRRGFADADGDAVVAAFGERAATIDS